MTLLSKEIDGLAGETTGSRLKTIRSLPGSVEIVGFTGALKFIASRGGSARVQLKADLDANIADEQPARAFVIVDRRLQKAWQQSAQRTQGNQSVRVFDHERGRQIEIASTNPGPCLSRSKLGIHRVVSKVPAPSVGLGAYAAQRFQKFEQADILVARTLQDRKL